MNKLIAQITSFSSKKLIVGPAAATGLLVNGDISSWEWAAVTLGYLAIQGLVDVLKAKKDIQNSAVDQILRVLPAILQADQKAGKPISIQDLFSQFVNSPIDEQSVITPKPSK